MDIESTLFQMAEDIGGIKDNTKSTNEKLDTFIEDTKKTNGDHDKRLRRIETVFAPILLILSIFGNKIWTFLGLGD